MAPSPVRPVLPIELRNAVESALQAEPAHCREEFLLRLERWWPDLLDGLQLLYPGQAGRIAERVVALAAAGYRARPKPLRHLDRARVLDPHWFQRPHMLGYAAYADRFAGTLAGVGDRIDYLSELGVTYLHLMPLLEPRPGDSDGGYAVADYKSVRADLGTTADLAGLASRLRARGISLVVDLVLNHVAAEHEWARRARAGEQRYRDYFHIFADRELPDRYEQTLPEVFPDFAPGNFTWDAELNGWVWTTFNEWQWDVNWSNPDVFCAYADIVLYLANLGVEVLRLDAIAFVWKRMGTDCQNQPEVHGVAQALRALTRIAAPATVFKAEAIVAPADLVQYLGTAQHHGKLSDLAYHNSLMVQLWSMLAARDVRLASHALRALPPIPSTTAWITYLRCHDDIGWAISDADAAAVGLSGPAHRHFLSDFYSGQFPGSFADGLVFQHNPATGDRRISGSAASLAGLGTARDEVELSLAERRLVLAMTVVLGWGGVPVIWMGDELGQLNDPDWADEPGHSEDNRWAHRPRLDEELLKARHDSERSAGRLFTALRRLATIRAGREEFDASTAALVLEPSDPGVLAVLRRHPIGPLLGLYNVTPDWRAWPAWRMAGLELESPYDLVTNSIPTLAEDGNYWLAPYAAAWLVPADRSG